MQALSPASLLTGTIDEFASTFAAGSGEVAPAAATAGVGKAAPIAATAGVGKAAPAAATAGVGKAASPEASAVCFLPLGLLPIEGGGISEPAAAAVGRVAGGGVKAGAEAGEIGDGVAGDEAAAAPRERLFGWGS